MSGRPAPQTGAATAAEPGPPPLTAQQLAEQFPPGRTPRKPALIPLLPEAPTVHTTYDALAADVAARLDGRRPVLTRSFGTYLGYDTFPCLSVHALAASGPSSPAGGGGPPKAGEGSPTYVCTVAVQDLEAQAFERLIVEAQARRRRAA